MSQDIQLVVVIVDRLRQILSCLVPSPLHLLTQPIYSLEVSAICVEAGDGCGSLPTLLNRLTRIIVGSVIPRVLARPRFSPFVLVPEFTIFDGGSVEHPIPHASSRVSLFSQPSIIREEIGDVFGLLTDNCALVLAILVGILELS